VSERDQIPIGIRLATDDDLIDFATTCSNRGVALLAEMYLRKRYPSRGAAKMLKQRQQQCVRAGEKGERDGR
jgi:hypothetical protein